MNKFILLSAVIGVTLCGSPALAQTSSSSAYALGVNQTVTAANVATVNVGIGPLAASSGAAPPSYDNSNSVASVNQNLSLVGGLLPVSESVSTGLLTSNSQGTATGAQATATIDDASVGISGAGLLPSLFGLTATTIQSSSQANSVGGLDASGSSLIEGLALTGSIFGSTTFDGSLFVNAAPNTILISIAGLTITLNEQLLSGDGTSGIGIATNAIHVSFADFPVGTGLKNGDIILGHSEAFVSAGQIAAVPEASTWAMMLIGFGAIGAGLRRGKKSPTLARVYA